MSTSGLTVWLNGSGGTGETPSQLSRISEKPRIPSAAQPLSAGGVLGGIQYCGIQNQDQYGLCSF